MNCARPRRRLVCSSLRPFPGAEPRKEAFGAEPAACRKGILIVARPILPPTLGAFKETLARIAAHLPRRPRVSYLGRNGPQDFSAVGEWGRNRGTEVYRLQGRGCSLCEQLLRGGASPAASARPARSAAQRSEAGSPPAWPVCGCKFVIPRKKTPTQTAPRNEARRGD